VALSAEAAAALLDAPVAVVWSPDATGGHPSAGRAASELEQELAAVAADGRRLAVIQVADLPPALGALVERAGLTRLLTAAAADGGAVLAARAAIPEPGGGGARAACWPTLRAPPCAARPPWRGWPSRP